MIGNIPYQVADGATLTKLLDSSAVLNAHDPADDLVGYALGTTVSSATTPEQNAECNTSDYISVTPNETLLARGFRRFWFYTSGFSPIEPSHNLINDYTAIDSVTNSRQITVPSTAAYIRFTYHPRASENPDVDTCLYHSDPRLSILWNEQTAEANTVYNSVATMQADENLSIGDLCETTGYYTANDGGGGKYRIREAATGETGNGGSAILLQNGEIAELIPEQKSVLNFKQWGAKADGTTDCSTVYANCVNYIKANYPLSYTFRDIAKGGGTIFIPSGTYFVANTLEARHYVHVIGENENNTIITSTASRVFFADRDNYPSEPEKIGRQNNFMLKNLTFNNCTQALRLIQCVGTTIENCRFMNCTGSALYLGLTVNVTIKNCLFANCGTGIKIPAVGRGPSTTLVIDRCWFRYCTSQAIAIECGENTTVASGVQPCTINDCIIEYNNKSVDMAGRSDYPTLINFNRCYFEGNTNEGTIENCSVFADMQTFFAPTGAGVQITPASYNKIEVSNLSDDVGFVVLEEQAE